MKNAAAVSLVVGLSLAIVGGGCSGLGNILGTAPTALETESGIKTTKLEVSVSADSQPIQSALVALEPEVVSPGYTNKAGKVSFEVEPDTYVISVKKSGFASKSKTVKVKSGPEQKVEFNLIALPTKAVLSGMVVLEDDGDRVIAPEVSVMILNPDSTLPSYSAKTGENGRWEIEVEAGAYLLAVFVSGYESENINFRVAAGEEKSFYIVLKPVTGKRMPVAMSWAYPTVGIAPLEVAFFGGGYDPDGGKVIYRWEFGDEASADVTSAPVHTYGDAGIYTTVFTVTDDEGEKASASVTVIAQPAPASDLPDIAVLLVDGPDYSNVGDSMYVSAVVKNEGQRVVSPFGVYFYLCSDTSITARCSFLGSEYLDSLEAGNQSRIEIQVATPLNSGTNYLVVIAAGAFAESNKDDNTNFVGIEVKVSDLIVVEVNAPATVAKGITETVWAKIKNQGNGWTSQMGGTNTSFDILFHLSLDAVLDENDYSVGWGFSGTGGLDARAEGKFWTGIYVSAYIPEGQYYLIVTADSGEAIPESDETNNTLAAGPITVITPDIDFVVVSVDAPASLELGVPATIAYTVRNNGSIASDTYISNLYLSQDSIITETDILVETFYIGELGPAESVAGTVVMSISPLFLFTGSYYVGIVVDRGNIVAETNEENNTGYDPETMQILSSGGGSGGGGAVSVPSGG